MLLKLLGAFAASLAIMGCETIMSPPSTPMLQSDEGYTGRVRLTRFLDEPDGYCLDVPGPANNIMLQFPLVAHTCHADPLADQVFQINEGGLGLIRWTTDEHDLCFTADEAKVGSRLNLRACDQPALQSFEFTSASEFKLSSTNLCIQVERTGPGPRQEASEGQDAYGRGRSVNPQFTHLARALELRECGDGDPAMSRWKAIL